MTLLVCNALILAALATAAIRRLFRFFRQRSIVGYRPQKGDTSTPALNLSGKWLREVGFDTGTGVTVRIAEGCIVLIPNSDEIRELSRQLQQTQHAVNRMAGEVSVD